MPTSYVENYERDFGFFKDYSREAMLLDRVFRTHGTCVERVLDIACGTGAHIVHLARMGYRCSAADFDPDMLDATSRAAAAAGAEVETLQADMRDLHIAGSFDAALNLFYSFQNILFATEEQRGFLARVAALLRPGGLFVIEVLPEENNCRLYPPGQSFLVHKTSNADGSTLSVTSSNRIVDENRKEIVFLYETAHADGTVDREEFVSPVRRVPLAEFAALTASAGFVSVAQYGDWDFAIPFGEDSRRLIAVLQKA
jgi:SAM-dependent methyltransferase